jgi:uncharacterized protein (TIGR00730 family)
MRQTCRKNRFSKRIEMMPKVVTVFGSSAPKPGDPEYETAKKLGKLIAEAGFVLKNGGYGGTMEAGASGAKGAAGTTIGVILNGFWGSKGNRWLDERICTEDLFERLKILITGSDAFVILPGSSGTLAEVAILLEMVAKKIMPPVPIIFIGDFWKPLLDICDGIIPGAQLSYTIVDDPGDAVSIIKDRLMLE